MYPVSFPMKNCEQIFVLLFLSFQGVEGTPAKKSRRGKEPAVVRSPSLNQGKLPGEGKPRIMFTGLVDKQGEKVRKFLNAWETVRFIWSVTIASVVT